MLIFMLHGYIHLLYNALLVYNNKNTYLLLESVCINNHISAVNYVVIYIYLLPMIMMHLKFAS